MSRRSGAVYQHPSGMKIKLDSRVPCENELWFADVLNPADTDPPQVVVAGASLDGVWAKA